MCATFIESATAHEFDSLGLLVRHKENIVSLISAPPLAALEINEKGEKLNFDINDDGYTSFQEIVEFEDDIAKRIVNLVVFQNEEGKIAKLHSFRLLEKGYENLLKIETPNDKNTTNDIKQQQKNENDKAIYIQLSLKFQWEKPPQSIRLKYGLMIDDEKHVLVRNQKIGESQVLVLSSAEPSITVYPITGDTFADTDTKAMWVLGVEHVLGGLDHILFILALTLVCKNLASLIVPLSAFTVAHSFALVLVIFGVKINAPSWLIEAGIAMTIVIMALFELVNWKPKRLFLLTALMGTIHGLGLGQALSDSIGGVEYWSLALVQVTVGVELAQLIIALIFLGLIITISKRLGSSRKRFELSISAMIICIGIFWTLERLFS
jgi:hydrogenase/urease accessory protein HupE